MGTFDFRVKKLNTYGYRLLAVPKANNITANGVSTNAVTGRIVNEDPTVSVGVVTVAWKKARNRISLFSGREDASGTVSTDADGYFTLAPIASDTEPGPWLMSFEALVGGMLIGDVVFWYEASDLIKGTENSEGVPNQLVTLESARYEYADGQYEQYSYLESATPSLNNQHPWLPPTWYAVSPEQQYQLNTDFNLGGYIGDREYTTSGILSRASAVYSPQFIEPINDDLYDTTGTGNNLSTATGPEIHGFEADPYVWFPGTSGNYLTVADSALTRDLESVIQITVKNPDYTPVTNQVLFDDSDGSSGIKATILTSGIVEIDLEASTYQTTNPNLLDGNKYTFEFETDFIDGQLIVNIYDLNSSLVFRELVTITETELTSPAADIYIGASRSNSNHMHGQLYDFRFSDLTGTIVAFDASSSYLPNGISASAGLDSEGNVITISRSSTAYKTTVVDRPSLSSKADTYFTSSSPSLDLDDRSFTIVFILSYWDAAASTQPLMMKKATVSTVADDGYALYLSGSNTVFFRVSDGSTQNTRSIASNEGNGLHYLAVVGDRNGGTIKLTDGTNTDSAALSMGSVSTATDFVLLNDTGFANGFQGNVVGAALFKEALTDAEILDVAQKLGLD